MVHGICGSSSLGYESTVSDVCMYISRRLSVETGPSGNGRQDLPKHIDCVRIGNFTSAYVFVLRVRGGIYCHCFKFTVCLARGLVLF